MKNGKPLNATQVKDKLYMLFSYAMIILLAVLFIFPLYWIITGSFKNGAEIGANPPVWWPSELNLGNFERLLDRRTAPLFELPLGSITITGPKIPGALRWLINTVFMSVTAMLLTCLTSAMAGYVLAKKKFWGRGIIFGMIVCAMALPKQVILIPLIREMKSLALYDTIWAVIFPIVGWPFGVFLLKQFSEGIPGEMVEAARIDGASRGQTLFRVTIPNVMPSITICMFLSLTNGFKLFDQNLALTGGLPYIINPDGSSVHTTEMLALNIYNTFYGQNINARGTAQAKAVLFFILVATLGLFQLVSTRKKEVQQ